MSLPNYLASIKSAGFYRFVWDKSQVPAETAQTMRLVVGYSEKGPFNTPVYVDKARDFKTIFGGINKKLERKGVYFHRLALQALAYGPILALNIKPFGEGTAYDADNKGVSYFTTDGFFNADASGGNKVAIAPKPKKLKDIFNTQRFWTVDPDNLLSINDHKYISCSHTGDSSDTCTLFIRDYVPEIGYDLTLKEYYNNLGEEVPEEYEAVTGLKIKDLFAEIYVFKGDKSTETTSYWEGGALKSYKDSYGIDQDPLSAASQDNGTGFIGKYQGILLPNFKDTMGNYISLDIIFNKDTYNHKCIMKFDEALVTETIIKQLDKIASGYDNTDNAKAENAYVITLNGYQNPTFEGVSIWSKVSDMLTNNAGAGIREALTNRKDVDYHYLVDTFETYENGNKNIFTNLCKEKQNAFAILNFPKMKVLETSSDYQNSTLGNIFDIKKFIATPPITLPTELEGASYGAFFTQVVLSDGTVKTTIPSAALVSNNFMEKWNSRQPYYIVAGPNYGRIEVSGLVGPDYNFGRKDLDVLEPLGINAIVYVPRKGTYINSNQTAKQNPVSALSKIHVRELVIYLQNEIETMLSNYQWELNTQALRDMVKAKADTILETVKNNGGVYAYVNVCDGTNNTPEVIDNEMLVLSTEIEPARGAGKMVQEITIHRTGGLTAR